MTTTRIILAGVVGGVAMFIWSAIAHMATPLAHAGMADLPNEQAVLPAMQSGIGDKAGLYLFPGAGVGGNLTKEQQKEAMEGYPAKLAANPSGLLMYHPAGSRPLNMAKYLTVEFLTEVLQSLIVVFLLSRIGTTTTFKCRVGFFFLAGILASIATNVSYFNWYGFPGAYTAGYMTIQIVGYLCAGLVAAPVLGKSAEATLISR